MREVKIFDTTLRDGAQTPGIAWTPKQKFEIGHLIDSLGVDTIEFGFPRANPADIELGKRLVSSGIKAELCALAMPSKKDVDLVLQSGAKRINFFVSCSKIQSSAMGQATPLRGAKATIDAVKYAREKGLNIEVTMMDAVRAEKGFLKIFARHLEKVGAQMLTLSDTVGTLDAFKTRQLFREISKAVKIPLSAHAHNDRGQATAISLAAVRGGARQVHVAVAGLGDKAGNAALDEIVLNLRDQLGIKTNVRMGALGKTTEKLARIGKFTIAPNKAFIGIRARSHSSALHIRAPQGFEAISPESIGLKRETLYGQGTDATVVGMLGNKLHENLTPAEAKTLAARLKRIGNRGIVVNETQAKGFLKNRLKRMRR